MSKIAEDVRVVDADTHLTEAHDLWTKRAPAQYKDRVPRVEEIDGQPTWVVDGSPRWASPAVGASSTARAISSRSPSRWSCGASTGSTKPPTTPRFAFRSWTPAESTPRCCSPTRSVSAARAFPSAVQDPRAATPVRRDLQRRRGRAAGAVRPALPSHARSPGVGRRRVRAGGRAHRRPRAAGRQHDLGPAGPRLARPGQPGLGSALGGLRRPEPARCTSTSAPASRP